MLALMEFMRSSWGFLAAGNVELGEGFVVGVLVALLVAALVGLLLWVIPPTRPFATIAAAIVFIIGLLLMLL